MQLLKAVFPFSFPFFIFHGSKSSARKHDVHQFHSLPLEKRENRACNIMYVFVNAPPDFQRFLPTCKEQMICMYYINIGNQMNTVMPLQHSVFILAESFVHEFIRHTCS
ncbi:hypothetical protein HS088_TW06G01411 [Tripterygium wilfordii]|uniref:Uncharacterized protein n=1 Tax=Tripterygium wilfordii TaxID=458696 RepID=A0A7J7DLI4_TRIWF|nr:hypothetical protein HS088_TW06G01411 [Tripterygium wilfordii]